MPIDRTALQPPFPAPWDALDPAQAARVAALTAAERVLDTPDTHDLILVAGFILNGTVPWETPTRELAERFCGRAAIHDSHNWSSFEEDSWCPGWSQPQPTGEPHRVG